MKKIFLFLAAVAALASCVEEKGLDMQQPASDQVIIKAVAAETKTTLSENTEDEGISVLWTAEDKVKVAFKSKADGTYTSAMFTAATGGSDKTDFAGTLDETVTTDAYEDLGLAVYPYHEAMLNPSSDGSVSLNLLEEQTGELASTGEDLYLRTETNHPTEPGKVIVSWNLKKTVNYALATVSLSEIEENKVTEAYFRNTMAVVRVNVPAGVKRVTLSSKQYLTGIFSYKLDSETGAIVSSLPEYDPEGTQTYYAHLSNDGAALDPDKTYYLLVHPAEHPSLTISMTGDGVECHKTISTPVEFKASEYYNLDLSEIFAIKTKQVNASPAGGDVVLPAITTTYENLTVVIPEDATWLQTMDVKGALSNETLTISAAENTGTDRSAVVAIKSGETLLANVTVSQKAYSPDLLGEYAERYNGTIGTLNIALNDDHTDDNTKGVYKLHICGFDIYADYADNILTVYDGENSVTFTVAADFSSITKTVGGDEEGFRIGSEDGLKDYKAVVFKGAPTLSAEETALLGSYDEHFMFKGQIYDKSVVGNCKLPAGGMTIAASEDLAYGLYKIQFMNDGSSSYTGYATYEDGKLTIPVGKQQHRTFNQYGYVSLSDIELTVGNDGSLTFSSWESLDGTVTNYSAVKYVEEQETPEEGGTVTAEDLVGTWHENFSAGGSYENDLMTIALSDDPSKGQLKVNMFEYTSSGSTYKLVCYANLSQDGKTLTVLTNGVDYSGMGTFAEDMVMTVRNGGAKIEFNKTISTSYMMPIGMLTATKL